MFKHNWAWIKLATGNFSTVLTRNLRNPRDYAPLIKKTRHWPDLNTQVILPKNAALTSVSTANSQLAKI